MRRLIRKLFKLAVLLSVGYLAYRTVSRAGTPPGSDGSRSEPPSDNGSARARRSTTDTTAPDTDRTAIPRPGAGTTPAGADRPASAPNQPAPGPASASARPAAPSRPEPGMAPPGSNGGAPKPGAPAATGPTGTPAVRSIGVGEVPLDVRKWVEPTGDGTCPTTHLVKAKLESGIFHVPGGQFYERTRPDRCYRDAASAEADGLRQAKA